MNFPRALQQILLNASLMPIVHMSLANNIVTEMHLAIQALPRPVLMENVSRVLELGHAKSASRGVIMEYACKKK